METNEHHNERNGSKESPLNLTDNQSEAFDAVVLTPERAPVEQNWPIRYAGFWMRFWAYLLDLLVVGSIERILIKPLFRVLDISLTEFNMFAPISIASAVIFYLYFVLMTKYFNQTLGKMVFGLKVVDLHNNKLTWGTCLFREWIGRFISATVILGYIIVAFLPKKQGLHDLFTDTTVIHVER
ncbi:RDD family protein [Neobacillus novalis]|uniref:RDD family protein n=1 Tax=Neobacillus novalis TaxID=220687 RepID=A0AA95MK19_9BACI|nr:RDD family protein [Neobacillus novalis]WHY84995.1 RDD family protein [Neobacillus novalis]